jgi:hypothetical protein
MNYVFTTTLGRYYSITVPHEDEHRLRTVLPVFKSRRDAAHFQTHVLDPGHGSCEWRVHYTFPMDVHMDHLSVGCVPQKRKPKKVPLKPKQVPLNLDDRDTIVALCVNGYGFMVVSEQSGLHLHGVVVVPSVEINPQERTDILRANFERSFIKEDSCMEE